MRGNCAMSSLPRAERRRLLAAEAAHRRSGDWGAWETISGPAGASGWPSEVVAAHKNRVFAVLERPLADGTVHLAVSSLSEIRPTWWEMQRIKDELAGDTATAVEVYPPRDEIVDGADMFHIWVLPQPLPFSLSRRAP